MAQESIIVITMISTVMGTLGVRIIYDWLKSPKLPHHSSAQVEIPNIVVEELRRYAQEAHERAILTIPLLTDIKEILIKNGDTLQTIVRSK